MNTTPSPTRLLAAWDRRLDEAGIYDPAAIRSAEDHLFGAMVAILATEGLIGRLNEAMDAAITDTKTGAGR